VFQCQVSHHRDRDVHACRIYLLTLSRFEKVRDIINVINSNQEVYWFDFCVLGFVIPSKTRQSHKMMDVNPIVYRQYVDFKKWSMKCILISTIMNYCLSKFHIKLYQLISSTLRPFGYSNKLDTSFSTHFSPLGTFNPEGSTSLYIHPVGEIKWANINPERNPITQPGVILVHGHIGSDRFKPIGPLSYQQV
jgi:hypothetical protein